MTVERARMPRWANLLAFLLPVLVHLPALQGSFLLDDVPIVLKSGVVKEFRFGAILANGYWENVTEIPGIEGSKMAIYRPLTTLSLATSYALWGEDATLFRLENVLLHALASWLLLHVLTRFCRLPWRAALFGSLVFAVLPVHVEAIRGIVLRNELLAAALAFAALLAHAGGHRVLAGLAFLFALFAKESAVALPVLCVALERVFRPESPVGVVALLRRYSSFLVALALYLGARLAVLGQLTVGRGNVYFTEESSLEVWLTMARFATEEYLGALVLGWPLVYDYSPHSFDASSANDLVAWVHLAGWCALGAVSVWATFRRANPWALCAFAFLVLLGPTSNLLTRIGVIGATRLLYLPSMAWALLLALLFAHSRGGRWAVALASLVLAGYAARTLVELPAWTDEESLYGDILEHAPRNGLANLTLGNERLRPLLREEFPPEETRRRADRAFEHLRLGLAAYPAEWPRFLRALAIAGIEADRTEDLLRAIARFTWPEREEAQSALHLPEERPIDARTRDALADLAARFAALPVGRPNEPFHLDRVLRGHLARVLIAYVSLEHDLEFLERGVVPAEERARVLADLDERAGRFGELLSVELAAAAPGIVPHARDVVRPLLRRFQDLRTRFQRLR